MYINAYIYIHSYIHSRAGNNSRITFDNFRALWGWPVQIPDKCPSQNVMLQYIFLLMSDQFWKMSEQIAYMCLNTFMSYMDTHTHARARAHTHIHAHAHTSYSKQHQCIEQIPSVKTSIIFR